MLRLTALLSLAVANVFIALGPASSQLLASRDAESAATMNKLGLRYRTEGKLEEAIASLRAAVELDPQAATYHFDLAVLYGERPEASARATGMSRQDVFAEMLDEFREAKALNPDALDKAMTYAFAFYRAGEFGATVNWDDAIDAWKDCLRIRTMQELANPKAYAGHSRLLGLIQLARVEVQLGRLTEAHEHLLEAKRILPDSRVVNMLLDKIKRAEAMKP